MKLRHWVLFVALIVGLLSGPSAMDAAASAAPLIDWSTIPIAFGGAFLGMLFVIGIQLVRRDPSSGRWALLILGVLSVFLIGTGVSSLVSSLMSADVEPSSALFLALGLGAVLAVCACGLIFRRRFGHSPL